MTEDAGLGPSEGAFPIAVLASGSGSNLQAILDRFQGGGEVEVVGVGSDKLDAYALRRAESAGVPTRVFPTAEYADRTERDLAMADWLEASGVRLIVLAGYMQILSAAFIARFPNRIVNVHPSLLPSFPGLDAIGQAFDHGVKVSGVTVHFVDAGLDSGPIIAQRAIELDHTAGVEVFESEVHAVEHQLLPEVISAVAAGAVRIDDANPRLVVR